VSLMLSQDAPADALLDRDPLALLLAMLLDQQVPMERAFAAPYELAQRLGHDLDVHELADYEPDALAELFAKQPALHRYPKAMAGRVQHMCQVLVEHYDGDATGLWRDVTDAHELLERLMALPGYAIQKAQRGVQPEGWRVVAGPYGEDGVYRSVADVTDAASLAKVREYKQQMKASKGKK
jgi:uncharacterized HhH-GPD family protein